MDDLIPLEQVAYLPPFPNPAELDKPGELAWLPVDELYIDPKYQRPVGTLGEKNIKRIVEGFSWSLFSPLVVARRGPQRYAVIDGQHRGLGCVTHGNIRLVPCYIINGDAHDEAKAFAVINGQVTAILPTQIYYARIVAGDLQALALQRVLDANGCKILKTSKTNNAMQVGETMSVEALEKALKQHGKEALSLALKTVVKTGRGYASFLRGPLIKATCEVLADHPEWLNAPTQVLAAVDLAGINVLHHRAEQLRVANRISFPAAYASLLVETLTDYFKVHP